MSGLTQSLTEEGKALLVAALFEDLDKRAPHLCPPAPSAGGSAELADLRLIFLFLRLNWAESERAGRSVWMLTRVGLRQALPVTCALHQLTALHMEIGGCQPTTEAWERVWQLALAPWTAARAAAAQCLRAMGGQAPALVLPALREGLQTVQTAAMVAQDVRGAGELQGLCMALVSMALAARECSHGVPCELLDSIMSVAKMLLKEGGGGEVGGGETRAEEAELMSSRVEGGWALICACLRSAADWVAGYLPVVLKLCSDFLPAAVGDVGVLAWQRSMLGAAGALSALTVLAQEHGDMLQALSGPAVTQMRGLLVRALQSDLVTKSAKVAATHGGKGAAPAAALLSSVLVDVVKLRVLELVGLVPLTLLPPSVRASVLKRALQVVARAPGKRGATSSLGLDLVHPDDDLLFPVPTVYRVSICTRSCVRDRIRWTVYRRAYLSKRLSIEQSLSIPTTAAC